MRIISLLLFILLLSCTNDPKLVQEFVSEKVQAVEQIKQAELLHTENGIIKVRIVAGKIERFKEIQPDLIFSESIKVYFYNDSSKIKSVLKAEDAKIDNKKKIMLAQNNVVLTNKDSQKLETNELIWDEKTDRIYTNKEVKITTGKEVIYGEGFTSNSDFSEYSIVKIKGTFDFTDD